jgi:hypothetical protein
MSFIFYDLYNFEELSSSSPLHCENKNSIAIATHAKFLNSIHPNKNISKKQIKCQHKGEHHDLCERNSLWPNIVHCDLKTSLFDDITSNRKKNNRLKMKSKDVLKLWMCESDSIMSSYIIIKCDNANTNPCDVSIHDCYVVFDPVFEYDVILSIIAIMFLLGVLIVVGLILTITNHKKKTKNYV